jgi:hypothetical protein
MLQSALHMATYFYSECQEMYWRMTIVEKSRTILILVVNNAEKDLGCRPYESGRRPLSCPIAHGRPESLRRKPVVARKAYSDRLGNDVTPPCAFCRHTVSSGSAKTDRSGPGKERTKQREDQCCLRSVVSSCGRLHARVNSFARPLVLLRRRVQTSGGSEMEMGSIVFLCCCTGERSHLGRALDWCRWIRPSACFDWS